MVLPWVPPVFSVVWWLVMGCAWVVSGWSLVSGWRWRRRVLRVSVLVPRDVVGLVDRVVSAQLQCDLLGRVHGIGSGEASGGEVAEFAEACSDVQTELRVLSRAWVRCGLMGVGGVG